MTRLLEGLVKPCLWGVPPAEGLRSGGPSAGTGRSGLEGGCRGTSPGVALKWFCSPQPLSAFSMVARWLLHELLL